MTQLEKYRKALERIWKPNLAGVDGMIVADMGFQHFAQHTAAMALQPVPEEGASIQMSNQERECASNCGRPANLGMTLCSYCVTNVPQEHCVCPDPIVGISKDGTKSLCSICTKEWDERKWSTHVPVKTAPFISHHVDCCIKSCDGNCYPSRHVKRQP